MSRLYFFIAGCMVAVGISNAALSDWWSAAGDWSFAVVCVAYGVALRVIAKLEKQLKERSHG